LKVVVLAIAVFLTAIAISDAEVRRLRLCADPSNLPFSSRDGTEPGFEVEIARAIAESLGAEFSVHWVPTVREVFALRQLYEGQCDLFMGLPVIRQYTDDKPRMIFSVLYYTMGQAVVSPAIGGAGSLDDLAGKLVGVQAMTGADHLVYERGYRRKVYLKPDETLTALTRGEVDAVVIESPLAGWFSKQNAGFRVVPIRDAAREFPIGVGVRKADRNLKDAIDGAIQRLQGSTIPAILARYGLTPTVAAAASPAPAVAAASAAGEGGAASTPAPLTAELRAARSTYLTQCSQCHGVDAKGSAAAPSLQPFKGTEADFVRKVLTGGRPGTAMIPWKGLISEDEIRNIARYVEMIGTNK
jgi:polar amino acid transport system substrate-binding protein